MSTEESTVAEVSESNVLESKAVSIEDLLNAGAHFGHLSRRWNPKMRQYIFMKRNGIHIIDLKKTHEKLLMAQEAAEKIASEGKRILFVGTKKQAREVIREQAVRAETNYVTERWLGGMLTNFATIRKSIKRLTQIEKMETDGTADNLTKKERLMLSREKERLYRVMGGIVDMNRLPGALFIVDIRKERLAIKEAKTLGIPVIAIVDTNVDPTDVDYPIPANDDSLKTIALIARVITDGVVMGKEASKAKNPDMGSEKIQPKDADTEGVDENNVRTRRRTRTRKGKNDEPVAAAKAVAAKAADVKADEKDAAKATAPATEAPAPAEEKAPEEKKAEG